jgi:hypothetical protein
MVSFSLEIEDVPRLICPEITKYNEDNGNVTPAIFYLDITPYFFVREIAAPTRRLRTK